MSEWTKVVEDGFNVHVNEEVGNIVETDDGKFVPMIPRVISFGPFDSLEEAKNVFNHLEQVEAYLGSLNEKLVKLAKES